MESDDLTRFMMLDFSVGMGDCLLVKMDIATMASSLEARCPFLDHHVMEWAATLPRDIVFRGRRTKPILRAMARSLLPPETVAAPKQGFEIPLAGWVAGPLSDMIRESLLDPRGVTLDLMERRPVESLLSGGATMDRERRAKCIWILFMLDQWDRYARRSA